MHTVADLLKVKGREVLSIGPEATVYDALCQMAERNVGALVVLDGAELVGIFSERDYARKVVLQGKASRATPVGEVLTGRVLCIAPSRTIEECMALMTDKHVRHLPVVEDGRVTAVISIGDLVKAIISTQKFLIEQLELYISGR